MKYVDGDLIEMAEQGHFDVIAHGCNCFHTMGAGIARQIAKRFPAALAIDRKMTKCGDRSKLGTFTAAEVRLADGRNLVIANCYTQYGIGGETPPIDYYAVEQVMYELGTVYEGLRIGMPKIGAGLAGGRWELIETIIKRSRLDKGADVTIVNYVPRRGP